MNILGLTYQSKTTALDFDYRYTGAVRIGLFAALVFSILNEQFGFDRKLADLIYSAGDYSWALQKNYWLQKIIHKEGRNLSAFMELCVLAFYVSSLFLNKFLKYRKVFLYVFVSVIASTSLVSIAKHSLSLSCPWEFSIYGGQLDYLSRISQLWVANGEGCFPAGHSSAGYAWMCIFFAGTYLNNVWRWYGLLIPLAVGLVFGFAQQLRGAHFLSDDIWTLAICWATSVLLYRSILLPDTKKTNHILSVTSYL